MAGGGGGISPRPHTDGLWMYRSCAFPLLDERLIFYSLLFMPVWESCFSPAWKSSSEGICCHQQFLGVLTVSCETRLEGSVSSLHRTQTHYSWFNRYLSAVCLLGTVHGAGTGQWVKTDLVLPLKEFPFWWGRRIVRTLWRRVGCAVTGNLVSS